MLAFCLVGGLFGVLVDDVPAIGRVFGLMFAAALIPFLLLLLTTWFRILQRRRAHLGIGPGALISRRGVNLQAAALAVGYFGKSTAVELRSAAARRTVSLATEPT